MIATWNAHFSSILPSLYIVKSLKIVSWDVVILSSATFITDLNGEAYPP